MKHRETYKSSRVQEEVEVAEEGEEILREDVEDAGDMKFHHKSLVPTINFTILKSYWNKNQSRILAMKFRILNHLNKSRKLINNLID